MSTEPSGPRRRLLAAAGSRLERRSIGALRSIDARATVNLKRAVPAILVALICLGVGGKLGGIDHTRDTRLTLAGRGVMLSKPQVSLVVAGICLVFLIAGVVGTRSVSNELSRVSTARGGVAAGSAIKLLCTILGYGMVLLGLMSLLRVDLGNLLVGGAVTGVIVGIAAQQTLGNFFAGLVLLFARPFVPGQRVRVNTGGMGGPFDGVILGSGLVYTTIQTDAGIVSMPNSGVLSAAIGPVPEPEENQLTG